MMVNGTERFKCILFNEETMRFYYAHPHEIRVECDHAMELTMYCNEIAGQIELDPTTMIRIARFNKEHELMELDGKIKKATQELLGLSEKMRRFNAKYKEVVDFIDDDFGASNHPDYDEFGF